MSTLQHACGGRVCAWCCRDLGPAPALPAGKVTHGICPACFAEQMASVDRAMTCAAGGSADPKRTGTPRAEAAGVRK